MPRVCRVCIDTNREAIDAELTAGRSVPKISREFGLPQSNLYRHRQDHLGLTKQFEESTPAASLTSIDELRKRDKELAAIQSVAYQRGHTGAFVQASNQRIRIILEIANLRGEISSKPKAEVRVNLDRKTAEKIAMTFLRHQQLTGAVIDGTTKP